MFSTKFIWQGITFLALPWHHCFKGPPAGAYWVVLKANRAVLTAEEALTGFHGVKKRLKCGSVWPTGLRSGLLAAGIFTKIHFRFLFVGHKHQISYHFPDIHIPEQHMGMHKTGVFLLPRVRMQRDILQGAVAKKPQQSSDGLLVHNCCSLLICLLILVLFGSCGWLFTPPVLLLLIWTTRGRCLSSDYMWTNMLVSASVMKSNESPSPHWWCVLTSGIYETIHYSIYLLCAKFSADASQDSVLQYPPAQAINLHILLNVFFFNWTRKWY